MNRGLICICKSCTIYHIYGYQLVVEVESGISHPNWSKWNISYIVLLAHNSSIKNDRLQGLFLWQLTTLWQLTFISTDLPMSPSICNIETSSFQQSVMYQMYYFDIIWFDLDIPSNLQTIYANYMQMVGTVFSNDLFFLCYLVQEGRGIDINIQMNGINCYNCIETNFGLAYWWSQLGDSFAYANDVISATLENNSMCLGNTLSVSPKRKQYEKISYIVLLAHDSPTHCMPCIQVYSLLKLLFGWF